ncbi:MAG: hypothetical protein R3C16_02910 [Hyphomonadaceae bacterium]
MRLLAPIALAAVLVACSAEAPTETPAPPVESEAPVDANALTANGWSPLRIGMTRAEVVAALGEDANPDAVGGPEPDVCDQFRPVQAPEDMLLMLENGVLTRISLVRNATLRTDRGFGLGDSADAIKAAYGDAAIVSPHQYQEAPAEYVTVWTVGGPASARGYTEDPNARGIRYEIGGEGTVEAIHAGGKSIQYVEGCL